MKIISDDVLNKMEWMDLFGSLIANSDRHFGNLSFLAPKLVVKDLAPAYDMLPMLYAPTEGHLIPRNFKPPFPTPLNVQIWKEACGAALDFWQRVTEHEIISAEFQHIASKNRELLEKQMILADQL